MAACAGLAGLGISAARATVFAPLQLPGHGTVVGGGVTSATQSAGTGTIATHPGNTVISWANTGGTIFTNQPGGFNIGQSATLSFTGGVAHRTVLNVDVTGTPSQIFGTLTGAGNYSIFVANANGITVGPNATITAPAGLGLIAATVNTTSFLSSGNVPISFASAGPLTVQGNLQGVGGFVLLAGSGAVNVSPVANASGNYFATHNLTVDGGVGGTFIVPINPIFSFFDEADGVGSLTPSATAPTTVTLNLGTSANPYSLAGNTVLTNGNLVNNGVLAGVSNAIPNLQWTGTLTNNGTINAMLDSGFTSGRVSFNGNTSSNLVYGGLVNNGTIATNSGSALDVDLPATIINNSGATISNVGGSVHLFSGSVDLSSSLIGAGGAAVINHGSVIAYTNVRLEAGNPNHVGTYAGGGVYSDGAIQILDASAHTNSSLYVGSFTGNAYLGGTVTTPNDAAGLSHAGLFSGRPLGELFTLATNVMADTVQYTGGSLIGSGIVTTNTLYLYDFVGNVNNVTGSNPLNNGFHVANGSSGNTNVIIDLAITHGGAIGRQVVNLDVAGNATLTSGGTSTFVNGLGPAGILPTEANAMSNLLVQASGNMSVNSSFNAPANSALSSLALGTHGFVFPGGIVLMAGNTLTLNTVVDNGYAPTVVAGQGIFFQAPHIVTTAPVITNGNAWVNFSTAPSTVPAIYGVTPALSISPLAYTIVANPSAYHIRSYAP